MQDHTWERCAWAVRVRAVPRKGPRRHSRMRTADAPRQRRHGGGKGGLDRPRKTQHPNLGLLRKRRRAQQPSLGPVRSAGAARVYAEPPQRRGGRAATCRVTRAGVGFTNAARVVVSGWCRAAVCKGKPREAQGGSGAERWGRKPRQCGGGLYATCFTSRRRTMRPSNLRGLVTSAPWGGRTRDHHRARVASKKAQRVPPPPCRGFDGRSCHALIGAPSNSMRSSKFSFHGDSGSSRRGDKARRSPSNGMVG